MTVIVVEPRFQAWEAVVMTLVFVSGARGLVAPPSGGAAGFLGTAISPWFYAALILAAVVAAVGMLIRGPNGLVISLGGSMLLTVTCSAVYIGLALETQDVLFSGAIGILIFSVGALVRSIQITSKLSRLRAALENGTYPDDT